MINGHDAGPAQVHYRELGAADGLPAIRPLWERLRDHHVALPHWPFAADVARIEFPSREAELTAKAMTGKLRIELAAASDGSEPIAYCVSSIAADGRGEVDSMYVDPAWRGHGIGGELVRRALAWMEAEGSTSKHVLVAHENAAAVAFYRQLGFAPRTVQMEHRVGEHRDTPGPRGHQRVRVDQETSIRSCAAADFDGVLQLLGQLWPDKPIDAGALRAMFEASLTAEHRRVLCAVDEPESLVASDVPPSIVGFGSLTVTNSFWLEGPLAYINELVVDERCRGRGIGGMLLDRLVDEARRRGCRRIELDSGLHRGAAHAFYARRGFKRRAYVFSRTLA